MELKEIILQECMDEVAKEYGYATMGEMPGGIGTWKPYGEALEKTINRLDKFYRWSATEGYRINRRGYWHAPGASGSGTDIQLYEIYKHQNP